MVIPKTTEFQSCKGYMNILLAVTLYYIVCYNDNFCVRMYQTICLRDLSHRVVVNEMV